MNKKALVLLTVTTAALSGCGLIKDRSGEYRSAREVPPLVVPDDLDSDALGELYPVPPIPETNVLEEYEGAPRPQPLSENSIEEVIKIQNLSDERWILSNRDPGEIWPRVRNILNRSGIPTTKAEATQGILETAWLEFKGDEAYNHRYRFYVQPGVQLNSTEIKVLHDQVGKDGEAKVIWPEESVDDAREKDMVEILANALAGDVSSGTVSLLAQSIGGDEKVSFVTPQVADPYLLMKLDYERAWASLAYSLGRGGFTTIDQDQTAGIFYVNYTPQDDEESKGWFSRLFSFGDDEKNLKVNCLVKVSRSDDGVQIRVTDKDNSGMERKDAIRLLKSIRVNLS
ncbi:MAG: outer membrane protein assembly factor BamC [Porticoccaceae bacterium]|nr:outer membrane protein assembly factor BamC [Porticoccaceae bacterium]